jgi:putative FmdB family regulatory protein
VPIYEYVCQNCRYRFEVKQSVSDAPISNCTRCGQAVTKVISAPAIMFKGTGWYITDYSDKLKPDSEPKAEDKSSSDQKKDGEPSAAAAPPAGATAGASSGSSAAPRGSPATAGSGPPPTTPAMPSSSSPK